MYQQSNQSSFKQVGLSLKCREDLAMTMTYGQFINKANKIQDKQIAIENIEKIIIDEFKLNRLAITEKMESLITELAELTIDEQN
jgi:hypothetical protein